MTYALVLKSSILQVVPCHGCEKFKPDNDVYPSIYGTHVVVCEDCMGHEYHVCEDCGKVGETAAMRFGDDETSPLGCFCDTCHFEFEPIWVPDMCDRHFFGAKGVRG